MTCHNCRIETVKAGKQKDGSQRYKCQQCGKRYTERKPRVFGEDSRLPESKVLMILNCLLEGNSVRATARLCDVEPRTVLHVLNLASERCERLIADKVRNVAVKDVQADEIWSFIQKKQKQVQPDDDASFGDAYCFVAIERHTKLVLNFTLGKRDQVTTNAFVEGLRQATSTQNFQITTDGFAPYVPALENTPAAVRFVSYEPALGPVDFTRIVMPDGDSLGTGLFNDGEDSGIDWLIVGGESGPYARPFDIAWARSVIDQCKSASVACFVKQLGSAITGLNLEGPPYSSPPRREGFLVHWTCEANNTFGLCDSKGGEPEHWPDDLRVREFPDSSARQNPSLAREPQKP